MGLYVRAMRLEVPPPPLPPLLFPVFISSGGSIHAGVNNWRPDGINHTLHFCITIIWRFCILWQPRWRDPVVDLYSCDAVKGTMEEYIPAAAYGKCALRSHIVLVITASLLCSSYALAGGCLFFVFFSEWLWANCCSFLNLHLAASCQTDKRWRHPGSCDNTHISGQWRQTRLWRIYRQTTAIRGFSLTFNTLLCTERPSDITSSVQVLECLLDFCCNSKYYLSLAAYFYIQNSCKYYSTCFILH